MDKPQVGCTLGSGSKPTPPRWVQGLSLHLTSTQQGLSLHFTSGSKPTPHLRYFECSVQGLTPHPSVGTYLFCRVQGLISEVDLFCRVQSLSGWHRRDGCWLVSLRCAPLRGMLACLACPPLKTSATSARTSRRLHKAVASIPPSVTSFRYVQSFRNVRESLHHELAPRTCPTAASPLAIQ